VRIALQRKRGRRSTSGAAVAYCASFDPRARDLLGQVGLGDFRDTLAAELSYGRKRALEIATTLALEPELMLLDEPTAGMATRT